MNPPIDKMISNGRFLMSYTLNEKLAILNSKPNELNVDDYCDNVGIYSATFYKWKKTFKNLKDNDFVEVKL